MTLQDAVLTVCRQRRTSMRALALAAGIEPGLFNAYVHGKRPNQRNAERVAAILDMDPRHLFQDFDQLRPY